jgi:hypothetical protein
MASWTKAITDPLKAASDLAQGMMELRDLTKLGGIVVKLNAEIVAAQRGALTAQQNEAELAEEVRALKAEIVRFEDWEAQKQRYVLKKQGDSAVLAYSLKEGIDPAEEPHSICPDCYQQRKPSILQTESYDIGRAQALVCQACEWQGFIVGHATSSTGRRRR